MSHTLHANFAARIIPIWILFSLMVLAESSSAEALHFTIINHHQEPVHADALVLYAGTIYDDLGVPAGTPLQANLPGGIEVPLHPATRNGSEILLFFVSLKAWQRCEMEVSPAAAWPDPASLFDTQWDGATGAVSNGLLRARFDSDGIDLFFDGPLTTKPEAERNVIENLYFCGWLDDQDSGNVYEPEALGLAEVDTRSATILDGRASLDPDGPTLHLLRGFTGLGQDVQCSETLTLLEGLPVLRYRLHFTNHGPSPAWIAWADGRIQGRFGQTQTMLKTPYWLNNQYDLSAGQAQVIPKYLYQPPAYAWSASQGANYAGVGFTTLEFLSASHFHNKTWWLFQEDRFSLQQVETDAGHLPIRIDPGGTAELGGTFLATLPETDSHRQTADWFESVKGGPSPMLQKPYAVYQGTQPLQGARSRILEEDFSDTSRWMLLSGSLSTNSLGAVLETDTGGTAHIETALQMDFVLPHKLSLEMGDLPFGAQLHLALRPLEDGAASIPLLSLNSTSAPDDSMQPLAHWAMDESSGATAVDSTGNGIDLDILSGHLGSPVSTAWDPAGRIGPCLRLDGSIHGSLPGAADALTSIGSQATLSLWVYGDSAQPADDVIFHAGNASGEGHFLMAFCPNSSGNVIFDAGHITDRDPDWPSWYWGWDSLEWSDSTPADWQGGWNHYAFVKDATLGRMAIYHNGQLVAEDTNTTSPMIGIASFTLGAIGRSTYVSKQYQGRLDEVLLYDRALNAEEIGLLAANYHRYSVDVSATTGWNDLRSFALEIQLDAPARTTVSLGGINLFPAPPGPPELISPPDGFAMTDVASWFIWHKQDRITDFEIEMADNPDFVNASRTSVTVKTYPPFWFPWQEQWLPDSGPLFWRVRGITPEGRIGEWSTVRSLQVSDALSSAPLTHPVSPENPLFTLEVHKVEDLAPFAEAVPEDLRGHVALANANRYDLFGKTNLEHFAAIGGGETPFLVRCLGPGDWDKWTSLADMEYLFQNYPNAMGAQVGENMWSFFQNEPRRVYTERLIRLCAMYGRHFIWGDGNGTTFKWQQLACDPWWAPFLRRHANYISFSQKNNVNKTMHTSQGALMGMYLSGMVGRLGSWPECWYWNDAGFGDLGIFVGAKLGDIQKFPRNFYNLSFMHGIAQGASVFNVEGQATTGSGQPAIWDESGNPTETFTRYLVPFMRGVTQHLMTPPRQHVLDKVQVAVRQTEVFENIAHEGRYGIFEPLYEATYGFRENGDIYEYFPNTGRYYFIPLLPYGVDTLGDAHTVRLVDLNSSPTVQILFDGHYEKNYSGDALVNVIGDRIFIQNTHENQDINETFDIPFSDGRVIGGLSGSVGPHKYLLGRFEEEGTQFWLQANTEYPERNTRLAIRSGSNLELDIVPQSALVEWTAEPGLYRLEFSHSDGAVEIRLQSQPSGAGARWELYATNSGPGGNTAP